MDTICSTVKSYKETGKIKIFSQHINNTSSKTLVFPYLPHVRNRNKYPNICFINLYWKVTGLVLILNVCIQRNRLLVTSSVND